MIGGDTQAKAKATIFRVFYSTSEGIVENSNSVSTSKSFIIEKNMSKGVLNNYIFTRLGYILHRSC